MTPPTGVSARERATRLALALLLAGLVGCGNSEEKAQKAARTIASWDSTLALLERDAARRAVPIEFARQVRRAAGEEQGRARGRLEQSGGS